MPKIASLLIMRPMEFMDPSGKKEDIFSVRLDFSSAVSIPLEVERDIVQDWLLIGKEIQAADITTELPRDYFRYDSDNALHSTSMWVIIGTRGSSSDKPKLRNILTSHGYSVATS